MTYVCDYKGRGHECANLFAKLPQRQEQGRISSQSSAISQSFAFRSFVHYAFMFFFLNIIPQIVSLVHIGQPVPVSLTHKYHSLISI